MNPVTRINFSALVALADQTDAKHIKEEFNIDLMPPDIKEALAELKAENRKETTRAAAKEVYAVITAAQESKAKTVNLIRQYRQAILNCKAQLEQVNKAEAYAAVSGNYLPICKAIGMVGPMCVSAKLLEIPLFTTDEEKPPKANIRTVVLKKVTRPSV